MKHPLADLIHAYAEGAKIQYRCDNNDEWEDVKRPTFDEAHYQYRIKPEANEPWKPKLGEEYWFLGIDFAPENAIWRDDSFDKSCFKYGNCFQTKEEAEAAIPRVEAALKGTTDVSDNVGSNVGSPELDGKPLTDGEKALKGELKISAPNSTNFQLDGKPLTDGEKALIRALRAAKIADIYPHDDSVIVYKDGDGELITDSYLVAFSIAITEGGRSALSESLGSTCAALNQIKTEQEAQNEAK